MIFEAAAAPVAENGTDWVAVSALVLALCLAAFELFKYHREGTSVRVEMRPGHLEDGMVSRISKRRFAKLADISKHSIGKPSRFSVETIEVTIVNAGRSPVTISNIVLDQGRSNWRPSSRNSAGFPFIEFDGYTTDHTIRLEPFDQKVFLLDASHALPAILEKGRTARVRVRASVSIPGRRRPRLSPRHQSLVFEPGDRPWIFKPDEFDLARQIYRWAAWRVRTAPALTILLADFAMEMADRVQIDGRVPTADEIREYIPEDLDPGFRFGMMSWDLAEELNHPDGGLLDGSGIPAKVLPARRRRGRDTPPAGG